MSRRALGVGLLLAALASPGGAQQPPDSVPEAPATEGSVRGQFVHPQGAGGRVPDVPAGAGRLQGQLLHPEGAERAAGVEVVLYALPRSGQPGARRTKTDASGSFAFENISADPDTAYLLGLRYRGIPFVGERVNFAAGETERRVEIQISDPTAELVGVEVVESRLRVQWVGSRLAVSESHRLRNAGTRAIYMPKEQRVPGRAVFRTGLPAGAEGFRTPLGAVPEGLEQSGEEVAFYGPLYPGEQTLSFGYFLPAVSGPIELRKRVRSGARHVVVQIPEKTPALDVEGLREEETIQADGSSYRQLGAKDVAPDTTLALTLELPPARNDPDALRTAETRLFLELDAAALVAREEHLLEVTGDSRIVASPGDALFRIPLPAGARDLRFDTSAFGYGLTLAGDAVELLGPIPPGEFGVEILYRVPVAGETTRLERRFTKPLDLLSVYVADTGVAVESDRLHRRRPVRTSDRTYLQLEGFQIEPDEPIVVTLSPLSPPASLPRGLLFGVVGLAAVLAIGVLTAPLRRGAAVEAAGVEEQREDLARRERDAVYAAIDDLEHDYETGKVSEADYRTLRQELRARAVGLLRQERLVARAEARRAEQAGTGDEALAAAPRCSACGDAGRPGDRFCASCGTRLAAQPAEERGASA